MIVIGFGAKIWIQLVEKGEIKNKFSIPYPIMYNPEKRQLHSLSIVDFRYFQCSRCFLGLPLATTTPTPSLTSGSLWLTANFRADFWPNLSYYWFEKKNLFRIVEKMNNFCFVINFLELLKKIFI